MATRMRLPDPADWRVVGEAIVSGVGTDEALAVLERPHGLSAPAVFVMRLGLGWHEEAIAHLQEMQRAGAGDLWRIGVFPEYDRLRDDPRFIEIVKELGVPNGWDPVTQTAIWP
jgi:hypothetical protein